MKKKISIVPYKPETSKRIKYALVNIADVYACTDEEHYEQTWKETRKQTILKELKKQNVLMSDIIEELERLKKYIEQMKEEL